VSQKIAALAATHDAVPAIYGRREFAEAGDHQPASGW